MKFYIVVDFGIKFDDYQRNNFFMKIEFNKHKMEPSLH